MILINEDICTHLILEQYISKDLLKQVIISNSNEMINESVGISDEVVKETRRICYLIRNKLVSEKTRNVGNGV